jgi:hypothetical protein
MAAALTLTKFFNPAVHRSSGGSGLCQSSGSPSKRVANPPFNHEAHGCFYVHRLATALESLLKSRAPCAAARSPVANGRPRPRDPPMAASPACGAPRRAAAGSRPAPRRSTHPSNTESRRPSLGYLSFRPAARSYKVDHLPLIVVRKRPTSTSDISWLSEPTTGVHQFG